MSFGAAVAPLVLEGDYSQWVALWKQTFNIAETNFNTLLRADESLNKLFIRNANYNGFTVRTLSTGAFESYTDTLNVGAEQFSLNHSVLRKYFAFVIDVGGVPYLQIWKEGSMIQSIDLSQAPISWTQDSSIYIVTLSSNGKYIFIENYDEDEYALFEGS